jgi:hypothetical protein
MQDVVPKKNSIASKSIMGGVAMSRKRSYDTDEFEAFKVESMRKAAKVEKDHLACRNDFHIQMKKMNDQHEYKIKTMAKEDDDLVKQLKKDHLACRNDFHIQMKKMNDQHEYKIKIMGKEDDDFVKQLKSLHERTLTAKHETIESHERTSTAQRATIEVQKSAIDKQESVVNRFTAMIDDTMSTNQLLHKKNLALNEKLSDATTRCSKYFAANIKYYTKSVAVREELNNLRYILEVGEDPVRGPPFCPVSQSSLLRNDTVAVFEGDCNCNSMVRQSVSETCIKNFNDGSDVRCLNCFAACKRIVFSTAVNSTSTNSWRKIEKLTGCGDFESVSRRNATILTKRLDDQKTIDTKNLRDCVKHLTSERLVVSTV